MRGSYQTGSRISSLFGKGLAATNLKIICNIVKPLSEHSLWSLANLKFIAVASMLLKL